MWKNGIGTDEGLLGWLQSEYGTNETAQLMADSLLLRLCSEKERFTVLQTFLDWFRSKFPYFHDECDSCGVSCRCELPPPQQQPPSPPPVQQQTTLLSNDDDGVVLVGSESSADGGIDNSEDEDDEEDDGGSFLGYIHPSPTELPGHAGRTELYHCQTCDAYTRFPRYNRALYVTNSRRGRCGEYSMLLYRILRALRYQARWVVDWADHVWAEVLIDGRWIHMDPCEAALDDNMLYSNWGKNQTFVVALYVPPAVGVGVHDAYVGPGNAVYVPPVEDVTLAYSRDGGAVVAERRNVTDAEVFEIVMGASKKLMRDFQRLKP